MKKQRFGRRPFLKAGVVAAGSLSVPLAFALRERAKARVLSSLRADPRGIVDLLPDFSYAVVERSGASMSDGFRVPGRPDGMACFEGPSDRLILMRNHELSPGDHRHGPYRSNIRPVPEAYDPRGLGGVTRVVLDRKTLRRRSSNLVLTGTVRNCAGGPSPWGWLSCEESVLAGHGYVFLCDPSASAVQKHKRIAAYGRFNHEAVAIDPKTRVAYLTEDRHDSCLYRFVPRHPSEPFNGRLQAMRVRGTDRFDTAKQMRLNLPVDLDWVDVGVADTPQDDLRYRAQSRGAAIVRRGEGIWYDEGQVYICATSGGPVGRGQIFRLDSRAQERLTLLGQSEDRDVLDMPDNIVVGPANNLFMAEDGGGEKFIRVLTPSGRIVDFARNAVSHSEFAGICFAPDGATLFVNVQEDGLTLAIRGPFHSIGG